MNIISLQMGIQNPAFPHRKFSDNITKVSSDMSVNGLFPLLGNPDQVVLAIPSVKLLGLQEFSLVSPACL